jgi:ferredoxin-like protein FixX
MAPVSGKTFPAAIDQLGYDLGCGLNLGSHYPASVTTRRRNAAGLLSALLLAACGSTNYSVTFENDLSYPVTVQGCDDCGSGHVVQPGQTWQYEIDEEVVTMVTRTRGRVVGCAYIPSGASTSEPIEQTASDFQGLLCDAGQPEP